VLAIIDEAIGERIGAVSAERVISRFHFAPELRIAGLSPWLFRAERGGPSSCWLFSTATSARIIATPHSDTYGACTPAPTIELSGPSWIPLMIVIAPADVPVVTGIERIADLASAHGVHLPRRDHAVRGAQLVRSGPNRDGENTPEEIARE
jgi:hypothetical protein